MRQETAIAVVGEWGEPIQRGIPLQRFGFAIVVGNKSWRSSLCLDISEIDTVTTTAAIPGDLHA